MAEPYLLELLRVGAAVGCAEREGHVERPLRQPVLEDQLHERLHD